MTDSLLIHAEGKWDRILDETTNLPLNALLAQDPDAICPSCGQRGTLWPAPDFKAKGTVCCSNCTDGEPTSDGLETITVFAGIPRSQAELQVRRYLNGIGELEAEIEQSQSDPDTTPVGFKHCGNSPYRANANSGPEGRPDLGDAGVAKLSTQSVDGSQLGAITDNAESPQLDAVDTASDETDDEKPILGTHNPEEVAADFLKSTKHAGALTLRSWGGEYWKWTGGRYVRLTKGDVKSELVRYLHDRFQKISANRVNDVFLNVTSKCNLLSTTQPGKWLDGGDQKARAWPVEDTLATRSHLINLDTLKSDTSKALEPATPRYFSFNATDYEFEPVAPEPNRWLAFLDQLWPGDPEAIRLLQQWMGYLLTPDTRQQKILFLVGPKRSGKGTILRTTESLLGKSNCCAPTLASLAGDFGLATLLGKSAALVGDARLSARSDIAAVAERLLSISGEDALDINRKHRDPITTQLRTRFTICSNELPRLQDASGALASRFVILEMKQSFFGREDHRLSGDLHAERQSILLWAIEGFWDLRSSGRFKVPDSSKELGNELEELGSPISKFIHECCELGEDQSVEVQKLYGHYKQWCEEDGIRNPLPVSSFSRDVRAACCVSSLRRKLRRNEPGFDPSSEKKATVLQGIGILV